MNSRQAKDFLVRETAEQATIENVSLSDIEKKMTYFTESDSSSCDKPLELNEEFEAQYETAEYEAKVSGLLQRACDRLKAQDTEKERIWDEAVRELRKGDHYLLALLDIKPHSSVLLKSAWNGLLVLIGMKRSGS
jgi:hypothetical protein